MLRPQTRPVSHFCTSSRPQPLHEGTGMAGPWALQLSCLIPNHGCVSHPPPPPTPPPPPPGPAVGAQYLLVKLRIATVYWAFPDIYIALHSLQSTV